MRRQLLRHLDDSPVVLPCAVVVVLLLAWTQMDGAQAITKWAPGTLLVLGLLVTLIVMIGWESASTPTRVAATALTAFTVWSYASILWAGDPGAAWEGANRTLLYLALFVLFALWRQTSASGTALLSAWTLGMIALAVVTLLRVSGATDPATVFIEDRLSIPAGYPNAAACMWMMALWPAIALAANPRLQFVLRGVLAGGAVVLAETALLSLSRGALFALPITAIFFFACFPGRLRHFAVSLPIAIAAAAAMPAVLDVSPALLDRVGESLAIDTAVLHSLVAGLVAGAVVTTAAWYETSREVPPRTAELARQVTRGLAIVTIVVVVGAGLVRVGNPVDRIDRAWNSFSEGYGKDQRSRLVSGLGSNRHDFYRVSLKLSRDEPLLGVGADNFFIEYLRDGRSAETPRYPHSVELRTASQLGIVGVSLLLVFLGAAAVAVSAVRRTRDPSAIAVAAGATTIFAYWFIHGSFDWFWEFAGLGAPAFAFLGLACALAPARVKERAPGSTAGRAAAVAVLVVAAVSVTLPWLSERDTRKAADIYDTKPLSAYKRLEQAARLNPLSARPDLVAGTIALRYGDIDRADRLFAQALERVPDDQYATLMQGAIASQRGDDDAVVLLDRAAGLAPRDRLTLEARKIARDGGTVNVTNLTREILGQATVFDRR